MIAQRPNPVLARAKIVILRSEPRHKEATHEHFTCHYAMSTICTPRHQDDSLFAAEHCRNESENRPKAKRLIAEALQDHRFEKSTKSPRRSGLARPNDQRHCEFRYPCARPGGPPVVGRVFCSGWAMGRMSELADGSVKLDLLGGIGVPRPAVILTRR